MNVVGGGRLGIGKLGFKKVRILEMIPTILSDITMMSYESYNHHLALTGQMTFNVRNFLVLYFVMTIIHNTCSW
jgi:hypothetical protein